MAELQRCVIRDELVEAAKLIQKRYYFRSWGDAVNMVFAAHCSAYIEKGTYIGSATTSKAATSKPDVATNLASDEDEPRLVNRP